LECCWVKGLCNGCPLDNDAGGTPCRQLGNKVLDLINRQQAENERLKAENEKAKTYLANCFDKYEKTKIAKDSLENTLYTARAEAIKEFTERLKKEKYSVCAGHGMSECVVSVYDINNLVKEMVGEDNV
jgi:hypothetical protein